MAATDALTLAAMMLSGLLALVFAALKIPEISVFFVICVYYFTVYFIGQNVGESRGLYRDILPAYFCVLAFTILTFAIIYYRYGLVFGGEHVKVSFLDSLYFSATTWTTLGYGDFSPIPRIRHITSIEAVLGYMGLGLWISLISSFIQNMVENRKYVREHNDKLFAEMKDKGEI